jgi:dienelactone hydrolase
MRIKTHDLPDAQTLYYVGPEMAWGAVPTIIYFSISGHDSLGLDPFNQPVCVWADFPLRVLSFSLPNHSEKEPATEALQRWSEAFLCKEDPITAFLEKISYAISFLEREGFIDKNVAVAGLSRGAFFATHLAARFPFIHSILGFAPVSSLSKTKEFALAGELPAAKALDLVYLADKVCNKNIRFYIGNNDVRVGTRACFDTLEAFCQAGETAGIRSCNTEMIMLPSIGHLGHGTAKTTFEEGAQWLAKKMGFSDDISKA